MSRALYRRRETRAKQASTVVFTAPFAVPSSSTSPSNGNDSPTEDSTIVSIAPSAQWGVTGVAGSGFGSNNPDAPTNPTRTTAKPWLRPLWVAYETIDTDTVLCFDAGAAGGLSGVDVWCEGNRVTLTREQWVDYTDVNGTAQSMYGWCVKLNVAATLALNATGSCKIVANAIPNDNTMQNRVFSQIVSVRSNKYTNIVKTIAPTGADFTSIKGFLDWVNGDLATRQRANGKITQTGNYAVAQATTARNSATSFVTITAEVGVTATIGDGTLSTTSPHFDGICFRGSNVIFDTAAVSYTLGQFFNATTPQAYYWLDGVTITTGAPNPSFGGSGSGQTSLYQSRLPQSSWNTSWWFTECIAHDLNHYGPNLAWLDRNSTWDGTSGSWARDCLCLHGSKVTATSSILCGLRTSHSALTITYSGAATVAQIEKTSLNGVSGTFRTWEDGVNTNSFSIANSSTVADLVTAINGFANWSATSTVNPADPALGAIYLSTTPDTPSLAISRTNGALAGSPKTISPVVIADVHSDVMPVITNAENVAYRFCEITNTVFCQTYFPNTGVTMKDVGIRQNTFQDLSNETTGAGTSELTGWHGTASHVYFAGNTIDGNQTYYGSGFGADTYCYTQRSHCDAWSWLVSVDTDQKNQYLTTLETSLAAGFSDVSQHNIALGGTYVRADLWLDPDGSSNYGIGSGSAPDYTPKKVGSVYPLQLSDGSFSGAKLPVALVTTENRGWNLTA